MKLSVPPRLRAPVILSVASVAALAVGGATHGWSGLAYVLPIPVVVVTAFFVLGGRDTDSGALIRSERDERQAHERLRVQAVVGRVLSIASRRLRDCVGDRRHAVAVGSDARRDRGRVYRRASDLRSARQQPRRSRGDLTCAASPSERATSPSPPCASCLRSAPGSRLAGCRWGCSLRSAPRSLHVG